MRELPPAVRLGAFALALGGVLAGSLWVGRATGDVAQAEPAATVAPHAADAAHDEVSAPRAASAVTGTSLSSGRLRLDVPTTTLPASQATTFTFRVLAGRVPVEDYDVEQGRQMHLVLVSRDLARHAHVHPELGADGAWSTRLTLAPGSYRAVADFSTGGERHSLAVDLTAPGPLEVAPLPAPATRSSVDGLQVELERAGSRLLFTASRNGEPVVPEPYLGARGHLVAFRSGDLAYAHVHPAGENGATTTYEAELPGPGTYRLFLELKVDGTVRTVPFTLEVTA